MAGFYRKWLRDIGDAQATFRHQCETPLYKKHSSWTNVSLWCDCFGRNCTGEVPPAAPWYQHG